MVWWWWTVHFVSAYISGINTENELTVVVCNTTEDVYDLLEKLQSAAIKYWNCHDESDCSEIGISVVSDTSFDNF